MTAYNKYQQSLGNWFSWMVLEYWMRAVVAVTFNNRPLNVMSSTVKVFVRFPSSRRRGKWHWRVETERCWHRAATSAVMRLTRRPYRPHLAALHTACLYAATRDENKSGVPAATDCMLEGSTAVARTPRDSCYQLHQQHRLTGAGTHRLASAPKGMQPVTSRLNETYNVHKDSRVNLHDTRSCMSSQCLITNNETLCYISYTSWIQGWAN